ncbi:MAG: RagB/SusD family nutrient uptake outer membrane protein [Cyclobacteriaceae bacterium]
MKAKNIYIVLTFLILATGCEDILTEKPTNFLSPENLNSVEGAEAVVIAAYDGLQSTNYYNGQFWAGLAYQHDFAFTRGSRNPHGFYNLDTRNIGRIQDVWGSIYSSINRANLIISSFPDLAFDEELKGQWIAEARILRALHYFNLVRCWGGVPLRIEPLEDLSNTGLAISTEAEVYAQIVADLNEAINSNFLPENYASSQLGRASVHAARTLLAHVHLTIGNWADAADLAQQVINSGQFQLEPDMYRIFSPEDVTHSGDIWAIKYARVDGIGANWALNFTAGRGTGYAANTWFTVLGIPTHPIIADWDDNDERKALNLYDTDPTTVEGKALSAAVPMLFKKFIDKDNVSGSGHGNDMPLYRYADALLIFAEADARAKGSAGVEAYAAANQVRRRAYGVDINTPAPGIDLEGLSNDDFIEAIMVERAHEFILEGKRWFDLTRNGFEYTTQQITSSGDSRKLEFWGEEDMLWPIPRQEIDNNDLLTDTDQNSGW